MPISNASATPPLTDDGAAADGNAAASASAAPDASGSQDTSAPEETDRPRLAGLKLDRKDRWLFYLMLGLLHVLSLLPDSVLYPLGAAAGYLGYVLDRRHVRIGLTNLSIAFPDRSERQRRRILRAAYANLGRGGAEYVRLAGFFHRRLVRRVSYDRFGYWNEIRRRYPGRGVVVLSAHFGNFELLHTVHAMRGHRITLVHHTQRFRAGDALMTWVRERAGVNVVRKRSAARAVLKALGDGELVGIPFDQNAKRGEAIFIPFFGEPASTSRTLARVVRACGAVVVPVFIVRDPGRRSHRIIIQNLIPLVETGNVDADVVENTRRFLGAVEAMVRCYPEQFLWTHRRYLTRPRGMAPVYDEPRRHRRSLNARQA
jgi:Kdo2-lipid IVA lauroyltransferase/acyltransferase